MPTIHTLAHQYKRSLFTYTGSVPEGVTLEFSGKPRISAEFFQTILNDFRGLTIPGGFNVSSLTPGGLGIWVKDHFQKLNLVGHYPRLASYIAAILVHEGYISSSLKRNAIMLHFPNNP
jgi:hypothetical protein